MHAFRGLIVACVLALLAVGAVAGSAPEAAPSSRSIALVVNVNDHGQVTEILPSERLPSWLHQALMQQLQTWIRKPAHDKHGKPISSRFIMVVAMDTSARADGGYDARFSYVKTMQIGFGGPVHWNVIDRGRELQLVSDSQPAGGGFQSIAVSDAGVGSRNGAAPPPRPPPPPKSSGGGH